MGERVCAPHADHFLDVGAAHGGAGCTGVHRTEAGVTFGADLRPAFQRAISATPRMAASICASVLKGPMENRTAPWISTVPSWPCASGAQSRPVRVAML